MQTAKCTQRTEVLVLEMKHYERLLAKRNPRTVDTMKSCLDLRLKSRMSKHNSSQVPLLGRLYAAVEDFKTHKQERQHGGGKHGKSNHQQQKQQRKTITEYYDAFIPPPGPLVDMYGPGTVFHHIRERAKEKRSKRQKGSSLTLAPHSNHHHQQHQQHAKAQAINQRDHRGFQELRLLRLLVQKRRKTQNRGHGGQHHRAQPVGCAVDDRRNQSALFGVLVNCRHQHDGIVDDDPDHAAQADH